MEVRVFILVRERTFADALATRLEAEDDVQVLAAVHARAPSPHVIMGGQADVILLDGDLPDDASLRLCEAVSQRGEAPYVVIISRSADPGRIVRAITAGAVGWVRKDESLGRLIDVIRGVVRGETWLPPSETGEVLRLLLRERDQEEGDGPLLATLTRREREVLVCLAEGTGRRDVARHLNLSANTVRTHLQNLMAKLGVHSALEAVALARPMLDNPPSDEMTAY